MRATDWPGKAGEDVNIHSSDVKFFR
jgi:hypothetical protein